LAHFLLFRLFSDQGGSLSVEEGEHGMATNPNGNVKLLKLAISIATVAAIAGIAGQMAPGQVPGAEEGAAASAAPGADQAVSPLYRNGGRNHGWEKLRADDWNDHRDDDWDDWDHWDDDREGREDGPRLWLQPRSAAGNGGQPPRTRTRRS